jgi:hypothetical protein
MNVRSGDTASAAATRSASSGSDSASSWWNVSSPPRPTRAGGAEMKTLAAPSFVGITPDAAAGRKFHS